MKTENLCIYLKATALNKIREICHPKYDNYDKMSGYWDFEQCKSRAEQRADQIQEIIEALEKDLKKVKEGTYSKQQRREKLKQQQE